MTVFEKEILEKQGREFPQDKEANEYRYIVPEWLDEIAKGLTKGAEKHPGETWRTIPCKEHLARAMRHINLALMGDKNDKHIINASMRIMMAFATAESDAQQKAEFHFPMEAFKNGSIFKGYELRRFVRNDGIIMSSIFDKNQNRIVMETTRPHEAEMINIFAEKLRER